MLSKFFLNCCKYPSIEAFLADKRFHVIGRVQRFILNGLEGIKWVTSVFVHSSTG